ncbi:MAG: hypothetical protein NC319_09170 [Butyricicoccus sp.]|nr:hypothetical protein [Butyricicoccus sp.]
MRSIYAREIFDFASELCASELPETAMMTLCAAAEGELGRRLRADVSAADIRELFVAAAGVLALSMYMAAGARPAVASFKAGNLAVSCADGGETVSAGKLRALAESMLSSYLRDEGFGFLGVRG